MAESGAPGTPESGHSGDHGGPPGGGGGGGGTREQDRFLPIANIGRIMRKAIPENGKIAKDAKESVQECVSEFISFITGEASDKCQREKRKTINGDDLLWAMTTLGFEEYVEPLKVYLHKFREMEGEKGSTSSSQSQHKEGGSGGAIGNSGGGGVGMYGAAGGGGGGGMMMIGQQMYGSPPSYHHQMPLGGKGSMGSGAGGGGSSTSSSAGLGRQGRV